MDLAQLPGFERAGGREAIACVGEDTRGRQGVSIGGVWGLEWVWGFSENSLRGQEESKAPNVPMVFFWVSSQGGNTSHLPFSATAIAPAEAFVVVEWAALPLQITP